MNLQLSKQEILQDYKIALISRECSLMGRREVLGGKAKFGIFGDGKEIPQLAMARAFRHGDWRSGYYRDQTFMLALNLLTPKSFFAQLYADACVTREPASGGRQMNGHFATRFLDSDGNWLDQTKSFNVSADVSPTGGQMARLLGLAYASKLYRELPALKDWQGAAWFSNQGSEVAFGTIGNASTSEGLFWETINAAGVLQVPLVMSIWDDGYGISVPNTYQTTKANLSAVLSGFAHEGDQLGFDLYSPKGYDYPALVETYQKAVEKTRKTHSPAIIHVTHINQPQGHSTSGSHERYKSKDRLEYEDSIDGIKKMREWILASGVSTEQELAEMERSVAKQVEADRDAAWEEYQSPIRSEREDLLCVLSEASQEDSPWAEQLRSDLARQNPVLRRHISRAVGIARMKLEISPSSLAKSLDAFADAYALDNHARYSKFLYQEAKSPLSVTPTPPTYPDTPDMVDGRQVIQRYFDQWITKDPRVFVIGEDIGKLGGVNLEFEGLNEKHGELRVTDTGIREATILGQAYGAAFRGLRPVADIQYLDYLVYCLQGMTDDVTTLHYRTAGGQAAPLIVRTKGHRLEGIWHTGSPMGMLLGSLRGMHICVPRNCVQAAGMYETLLRGEDPGLVIEVLNGYRVKENCPTNLGNFSIPLGVPEILREGRDITVVTYGANVRIAEEAAKLLVDFEIDLEVIDIQTLLPFDRYQIIRQSIEKTNAVLFFDEDVSGGATGFMMQKVLEEQRAYEYLDAPPRSLSAKDHRSAYGSDGDYYCKPSTEDVMRLCIEMTRERGR